MTERIRQDQISKALSNSRRFEHAWRVDTYPKRFSSEEVVAARKFISENKDNFEVSVNFPPTPPGWDAETFSKVFAGLYHRGISYPKNALQRNFRDN